LTDVLFKADNGLELERIGIGSVIVFLYIQSCLSNVESLLPYHKLPGTPSRWYSLCLCFAIRWQVQWPYLEPDTWLWSFEITV